MPHLSNFLDNPSYDKQGQLKESSAFDFRPNIYRVKMFLNCITSKFDADRSLVELLEQKTQKNIAKNSLDLMRFDGLHRWDGFSTQIADSVVK